MQECLGIGVVFLLLGLVMLLLSLTKTGRRLTKGYNRLPLPREIRKGPTGDLIANTIVACAGVMLLIVGLVGVAKGVSAWVSGVPCE